MRHQALQASHSSALGVVNVQAVSVSVVEDVVVQGEVVDMAFVVVVGVEVGLEGLSLPSVSAWEMVSGRVGFLTVPSR